MAHMRATTPPFATAYADIFAPDAPGSAACEAKKTMAPWPARVRPIVEPVHIWGIWRPKGLRATVGRRCALRSPPARFWPLAGTPIDLRESSVAQNVAIKALSCRAAGRRHSGPRPDRGAHR